MASMEITKMPIIRNGSKGGFEPGLTRLRVRHSTAEPLHNAFSWSMKAIIKLYWNGQLVWTPALGLVREGGCVSGCPHHVELHNNVRLLLNVVWRNITSDCYLNIVVSLDCYWTCLLEYIQQSSLPPSPLPHSPFPPSNKLIVLSSLSKALVILVYGVETWTTIKGDW